MKKVYYPPTIESEKIDPFQPDLISDPASCSEAAEHQKQQELYQKKVDQLTEWGLFG